MNFWCKGTLLHVEDVMSFRRLPRGGDPPLWPATLRHQVFDDAIKIATSLVVCFLQSQFHHRWQHHGAVFIKKIKLESPRSSAGVLSHNTPAVLHRIQAIFTKNCSSKSRLSLSSKWIVANNGEVCRTTGYL
jgi:hypothetical protein